MKTRRMNAEGFFNQELKIHRTKSELSHGMARTWCGRKLRRNELPFDFKAWNSYDLSLKCVRCMRLSARPSSGA